MTYAATQGVPNVWSAPELQPQTHGLEPPLQLEADHISISAAGTYALLTGRSTEVRQRTAQTSQASPYQPPSLYWQLPISVIFHCHPCRTRGVASTYTLYPCRTPGVRRHVWWTSPPHGSARAARSRARRSAWMRTSLAAAQGCTSWRCGSCGVV